MLGLGGGAGICGGRRGKSVVVVGVLGRYQIVIK